MTAPQTSLLEAAAAAEDLLTGYHNALKAERDGAIPAPATTRDDLMQLQSLMFEIHDILYTLAARPTQQPWAASLQDAARKAFDSGLRLEDVMPPTGDVTP